MKRWIFLLFFFSRILCYGQQETVIPFENAYKRVYDIRKISEQRPVIDGRLDDSLWTAQGEWSEPFVQVMPYERVVSPSPTRVKLFYDDRYIYIGVYCKDAEPDKMNRFINNRDENRLGDLISIAFDTYHDYRAAPEFNINLGGNKTDLIVTDRLNINLSWNAVWEGKTNVNPADSSWTAEIRIPFSQLRYNRLSDDGVWGLHVRRIIRRNNEVQNWSLIPLKNNGHVFSFGEMHGMTDLPKPGGIEILPHVMSKYRNAPLIPGSPYQKGDSWKANAGLDAKFALADFTMDVTVNPDFGQIELDPSVMNLTAYETFYDEKRPFFLEGKHILDFANGSDMMFYSRRIGAAPSYSPENMDQAGSFSETKDNVPIIEALKLTGTNRRGLTLGLMQSVTARSVARVSRNGIENRETVEPPTGYTVARVQKNWKGNTLLGGMITSVNRALDEPYLADFMIRNAFTAGVDFSHYFSNRLYYVDMKGMFSSLNGTKEAVRLLQMNPVHYFQRASAAGYAGVDNSRTALNGTGGYLKIGRKGNSKWVFSETFDWASAGFDLNDAGYLKQADLFSNTTEIEYRQTDVRHIFRSNRLTLIQKNQWDYGRNALNNYIGLNWRTMFLNRYEITLNELYGWNQLDTRLLRGGPDMRCNPYFSTEASFNTDRAEKLVFTMKYTGNHSTGGHRLYNTFSPALTFRMSNHLYLSGQFNYARNRDHLQYVTTLSVPWWSSLSYELAYLMGAMEQQTYGLTMNMQLNITPDISVQLYGSPFTSAVRYTDFKTAARTTSKIYEERFQPFTPDESDPSFHNPDFHFNEFRSNLVARWEYMPGSTLYFVWEHRMSNQNSGYLSGWGDNLNRMLGLPATNTLMVKLNYWINL
jgi:hypothetical protein